MATQEQLRQQLGPVQSFLLSLSSEVLEFLFGARASKFKFVHNDPSIPFSSTAEVVMMVTLYLYAVFFITELMKIASSKASNAGQDKISFSLLNKLFVFHNYALSLVSAILLSLYLLHVLPRLAIYGLEWTICSSSIVTDSAFQFLCYINYLLKYYELLDTVFIILKRRPLEFLHVYHHSCTFVLCFTQLIGAMSVQWIPITLNLCVHVIMYYYYARVSSGHKNIWWKKHLTMVQILQFVVGLMSGFIFWPRFLYRSVASAAPSSASNSSTLLHPAAEFSYDDRFTPDQQCHGSVLAALWGQFVLMSYLFLFLQFYIRAYIVNKRQIRLNAAAAAANQIRPSSRLPPKKSSEEDDVEIVEQFSLRTSPVRPM